MSFNQNNKSFQMVACPRCDGYGYALNLKGEHVKCAHCQETDSMYGFVDDQILYWHKEINNFTIIQEKSQALIKNFINFILILLSIVGFTALAWHFFQNQNSSSHFFNLLFSRHDLVLLFWVSVVGDMYIYYRLSLDSERKIKIRARELGAELKLIKQSLNWKILYSTDASKKLNIAKFFNQEALQIINSAYLMALHNKQHEILPIDLLIAVSKSQDVHMILARLNIYYKDYYDKIRHVLTHHSATDERGLDFGAAIEKAFLAAYFQAYKNRRELVTPVELLMGLLEADKLTQDIFCDLNIDLQQITNVCEWIHLDKQLIKWARHHRSLSRSKPKNHMNRSMTARPTKTLDSVSQDLTIQAKYNHFLPLVGREKEIAESFRILKEGRGSVILLGESGTGKTTILEGVAQLMASEDVPENLQDKRLVSLDPGVLIAGASGVGGLEGRMVQILNEIVMAGNVILAIEDIHNLLNARSTQSGSDVGEILMNYISQGYIQVLATSTTQEFRKYIANKETFLRRFQVVKISEMSIDEAINVLEARAGFIEAKEKVYFSYSALESCVKLSERYIKDRHLPSKALDILEESAIYCREKKGVGSLVNKDDVATVLAEKTNVEVNSITQSEASKLLNLEELMHERIVGQNEAIDAIAKALRRAREDLRDNNRPIASFLFLGPTGVGKTETAKTIAEVYFGDEKNMIRLDMSEYQSSQSVSKMIGDEDHKGYLTEAIRQQPFSIILLDEIEKAHPDILNLFLQVTDDGRLTDGQGRTIDFTNAVIVATSNAATQAIQDGIKSNLPFSDIYDGLMDGVLEQYFRVEFLNRFDKIVIYKPLEQDQVIEITRRLLIKLADQLEQKGIIFDAEDEAVQVLAKKGYSQKFGARPLKRILQDTVDDALAKLMLSNSIGRRDSVLLKANGELEIQKAEKL
ncbi:MAG: ATP-dependent Clp protease ATP-binding subunit [Patescibacteria group bacterium]